MSKLQASADGKSVDVLDAAGVVRVRIVVDYASTELCASIHDEAGRVAICAGITLGGPCLNLYDEAGRMRASASINTDRSLCLLMHDEYQRLHSSVHIPSEQERARR